MSAARKLGKRAAGRKALFRIEHAVAPIAAHRNDVAVVVGTVVPHTNEESWSDSVLAGFKPTTLLKRGDGGRAAANAVAASKSQAYVAPLPAEWS